MGYPYKGVVAIMIMRIVHLIIMEHLYLRLGFYTSILLLFPWPRNIRAFLAYKIVWVMDQVWQEKKNVVGIP